MKYDENKEKIKWLKLMKEVYEKHGDVCKGVDELYCEDCPIYSYCEGYDCVEGLRYKKVCYLLKLFGEVEKNTAPSDTIEDIKTAISITEKVLSDQKTQYSTVIEHLNDQKKTLEGKLKEEEERLKESWIVNPSYLVLSSDGSCVPYECEWKKYKDNVWRKGYIVGSSCATSKLYKVRTSIKGDKYEWACTVRIDPMELKDMIKENTIRMCMNYDLDIMENN